MADLIKLDHGSGGLASNELIKSLILSRLDNEILRLMEDSAVLDVHGVRLAFTTDSYVIDPPFFPGGDIGSLAVHGTVNDLAMRGAEPIFISLSLILEEGLPMDDLRRIMDSAAEAARRSGVFVAAGDTKVVPRGHADRIFINTSGIGTVGAGINISCRNAKVGDAVIINGTIGDHGMAVLACREGLAFESPIASDSAPLNSLVSAMIKACPGAIRAMRDPTRGGVATAVNEIASASGVTVVLEEARLPISPAVAAASEMLGLDPLYVANEGKCIVFADPDRSGELLEAMRAQVQGKGACVIGTVAEKGPAPAVLKTRVGGTRILPMLTGEQLPRIC
jgi:hydrogenase expression/formation protein HypE